jgi:hypothetical protein
VTRNVASEVKDHRDGGKDSSAAVPLRDRLIALVGTLETEATDRVAKRESTEARWLEDLRQFHGKYDEKITRELSDAKKSTIFINQTRPKTNALEARLSDMLFPTDDKNWGIQPTPIPELTVNAEQAAAKTADLKLKAAEDPENPDLAAQATEAERESVKLQVALDEAKNRAQAMEQEIFDMLKECKYEIQAREVIRDACKIGTGVMKGPVTGGKPARSWKKKMQPQAGPDGQPVVGPDGQPVMVESNVYELAVTSDSQPKYWRVDPWHFFPESDACNMGENESVFERHLMNPKALRKLAQDPNFDKDAIRRLLKDEARSKIPTFIADLRSMTGENTDTLGDRYTVWEYHGPITAQQVSDLAEYSGDDELMEILGLADDQEPDPLKEINAVLWFCQARCLNSASTRWIAAIKSTPCSTWRRTRPQSSVSACRT